MIDDPRRQFFLHGDGSVDATMDVVVCGQTARIDATVEVVERIFNEGGCRRVVRPGNWLFGFHFPGKVRFSLRSSVH